MNLGQGAGAYRKGLGESVLADQGLMDRGALDAGTTFEYFAGVPACLIFDNLKTAITHASYHDPAVQRAYPELAEGYGFRLAPHPVRHPQMKGRIEVGVKYVKRAFVPLRDFRSLAGGNQQLRAWRLGPAGNRIHGTTHERPLTRFVEVERYLLAPWRSDPSRRSSAPSSKSTATATCSLPKAATPFPTDSCVKLWLRAAETTVRVFRDHEPVAVHARRFKPGSRSTLDEHLPPEALAYKMQGPQWCLTQAQAVGPHCHELIETLFAHRVLDNLRAAQGVIRLGTSYGTRRLEAACARALAFDNALYRTVKTILEKGADQEPLPRADAAPLSATYTGQGRFCRDTAPWLNIHPPSNGSESIP